MDESGKRCEWCNGPVPEESGLHVGARFMDQPDDPNAFAYDFCSKAHARKFLSTPQAFPEE